ncbi:microsomal triglyceride transfer protein large subunit-like isoform X2 [Stegodyphus dumicola]|uniref:microsomal triglyceride transfer protein large subunit-like isoform X2 n=1 Tax=Stegodyphus dumicola TaxID=202533 RepID=UPI0015AEB490|nr:microsomal triglyceride transfer protein large subunit-like isoform X2 [Stegodyphus dumicola]
MWIVITFVFSVIVSTLQYETGLSYKYNYQFTILVNEDSNITSRSAAVGRNVGYKVSSEFLISNIWENSDNPKEKLLKLELLKPELHVSSTMHSTDGINRHWSKLDNLSYPPIYIHWHEGIVKKVYLLPDSPSLTNIKKGLASLFQVHVTNNPVKELDVSGLCEVQYKVHGSTIKKNKHNCRRTFYQNNFGPDQAQAPSITTSSEMIINLVPQENIIQKVTGREEVMMSLNLWKQAAVFIKAKLHVNYIERYGTVTTYNGNKLASVLKAVATEMGSQLKEESLEVSAGENACIGGKCKSLSELIGEYGKNLLPENLGQVRSAAGFLKLLDGFRRASKKELLMTFKNTDEKILTQLLDILAAAQTDDSLDVAFQLIDFESKDIEIAERFLLCLATVPYPNEVTITKLLKLFNRKIKSEKLRATMLISLSSLAKTYSRNNPKNMNSLIVQSVSDMLLRELSECDHAGCILNHILALRNAALPQHIPTLLEYIKKGGILGLVSLEAIKDIGEQHFTREVNDVLLKVYNQFWPHQEPAARVLAAEILIRSNPTIETIGNIVLSLSDQQQPEISTLVLSKLYTSMQKSDIVRSCVKEVLRNVTFGNYNNLAQNGSSTSFINILQATHDANVTYGINMEMRPTGMLRRTSLDLNLMNNQENLHLLSVSEFHNHLFLREKYCEA